MITIDTNIVIYAATGRVHTPTSELDAIIYPPTVRLESLGFHGLLVEEQRKIDHLLSYFTPVNLIDEIVELAIALRQAKSMSLGDAIVAATALHYQTSLWTANVKDFEWIEDLKLINPLAS